MEMQSGSVALAGFYVCGKGKKALRFPKKYNIIHPQSVPEQDARFSGQKIRSLNENGRIEMKDTLRKVCEIFCIEGTFDSYEEITIGNINRTYKVNYIQENGEKRSYMVQAVNTFAFKDPVAVMENIEKVTEHIRSKKPGYTTLDFYRTKEHKSYFFEGESFWRVFNHIPSVTHDVCDDLQVVCSAGQAFGAFQKMLADFDAQQLHITIPDFHNTQARYEKLEADMAADPLGKVSEVREELDWLLSVKEKACRLVTMQKAGQLPLRVTHNDTKINNVLFDQDGCKALVVIDLDTVMPGLVGFDFGDAIRFAANRVAEDSREWTAAGINLDVFRAFTEGFLKDTADMLTQNEKDTLALSCFVITCEQAVRFVDDYIMGSPYFKINYPEHNLVRTRCQLALAKDMEKHLDEMNQIVQDCLHVK